MAPFIFLYGYRAVVLLYIWLYMGLIIMLYENNIIGLHTTASTPFYSKLYQYIKYSYTVLSIHH